MISDESPLKIVKQALELCNYYYLPGNQMDARRLEDKIDALKKKCEEEIANRQRELMTPPIPLVLISKTTLF